MIATIYSLLASHAHLILPCEAFQVMEEHDREPKTDTPFVMCFSINKEDQLQQWD